MTIGEISDRLATGVSIKVWFDPRRGIYRIRKRTRTSDTAVNVPRDVFTRAGVDPAKPSTKAERLAWQWAAEIERRAAGRPAQAEMTIEEIFELWKSENPNNVKAKSVLRNGYMLEHIAKFFRDESPSAIDLSRAVQYRNWRRKATPAPSERSIKNELQLLKQMLLFGYQYRRDTGMRELSLLSTPATIAPPPRGRALMPAEVRTLMTYHFDHCGETILRAVILGIATGLRVSVLMGMRREWIDRERRWLTIPGEYMKGGRELSVPLGNAALVASDTRGGTPFVFENFNGRPMKWPDVSIRNACKKLGIGYFSAHDLRRTMITWLEDAGMTKLAIKGLVGHSGGDVTDGYVRMDREKRLREAVDAIDEILRPMVTFGDTPQF